MGAFANGFKLGQNAWQQNLDNRDRERIRSRQDEEHQWKVDDRQRLATDRTNLDDAIGSFQSQQNGIYEGSQGPLNTPMPLGQMGPSASAAPSNVATGLAPRAPTKLETNQGLSRIAMAQRDVNAMGTLATQAGTLRIDQKFADAMKTYKGDPEQVGSTIEYINGNSRSITMSDPDKNGLVRMSVVTPDKKAAFIKLSKQDQAQIYAAGMIMEDDPTRALAIMAGVNKTMAEAYALENGLTKFMADNTNDVSAKGASMENDRTRLSLEREKVGIARGAAARQAQQDRLGRLMPMVGADGQPTYGEATLVGGQPTLRPINMGGLKVPPAPPNASEQAALKEYYSAVATNPQAPQRERDMLADQLGIRKFVGTSGGLSFGGTAGAGATGAQGEAQTEQAPQVPGRPFYSEETRTLQQMARKPRGVSSAEASAAQAELDARKGESRMSGF